MSNAAEPIRLERTYDTSAATIWELWTTADALGLNSLIDFVPEQLTVVDTG